MIEKAGNKLSDILLQKILSEIIGLRDDMDGMKSDINDMKTDMDSMKSDINNLKSEMNDVKTDVTSMKTEQKTTNERLLSIEKKQNLIYSQTRNLTTYHTEIIAQIEQLHTDMEFTYQKTALHDLQLNRLQNISSQNQ